MHTAQHIAHTDTYIDWPQSLRLCKFNVAIFSGRVSWIKIRAYGNQVASQWIYFFLYLLRMRILNSVQNVFIMTRRRTQFSSPLDKFQEIQTQKKCKNKSQKFWRPVIFHVLPKSGTSLPNCSPTVHIHEVNNKTSIREHRKMNHKHQTLYIGKHFFWVCWGTKFSIFVFFHLFISSLLFRCFAV